MILLYDQPAFTSTAIPMTNQHPRICIFAPSFGDGGVERMLVNLATQFSTRGIIVDLIVNNQNSGYLKNLPGSIHLPALAGIPRKDYTDFLLNYFTESKPDIILSSKPEDDRVVRQAKLRTDHPVRFFIRCPTAILSRMKLRRENLLKTWLKKRGLKKSFMGADGIIAVSKCVADEVNELISDKQQKIIAIKNPNITPELRTLASQEITHPWFQTDSPPAILGIGGFRKQKDFSTLIRAFALVKAKLDSRLVILGQGRQKKRLQKLIDKLNMTDFVDLHGFVENPYPFTANADLFVLSSLWEGSPNVLTEALALGTAVVSTNCHCGPAEILQNGQYGELVALQDPEHLSEAILKTLNDPLPAETLREAARDYTLQASADAYLQAFGLDNL